MDRNLIARGLGIPGGILLMGASHAFLHVNGVSRAGPGWSQAVETAVLIGAFYLSVALFFHFRWFWVGTRHVRTGRRGQIAAVLLLVAVVTQAVVGGFVSGAWGDSAGTISPARVIGAQQ